MFDTIFLRCDLEVDDFKYKGHAVFGLVCALGVSYLTGLVLNASHIFGILIGVMLPDMDHPQSKINYKLLKFNNRLWKVIFYITVGFIALAYGLENDHISSFLGIALMWTGVSEHRTFTHSLLGGLLYSLAFLKLSAVIGDNAFVASVIFGYWSHLASDSVTKAGVHWMYPLVH